MCPLFGTPRDLPENKLPTYEDVMRCCSFERQNLAPLEGSEEPEFSKIASIVAQKTLNLYEKASIPSVSYDRTLALIKKYHDACNGTKKSLPKVPSSATVSKKVVDFKMRAKKLFDFATCKCVNFDTCSCEKSKRVPVRERAFLTDQRTDRKLFIGGIDEEVTRALQKRELRKSKDLARSTPVLTEETANENI